ncbi:fluoride efflux transporter CrcB [Acetobacter farinalis]|uniref:Fluoride-specific ion channel FluC n=1 Tax=Acetobacter farinalis TaxID=1260984 RepID=A0ABT3Q8S4_9PROT|nr:fluoride efflux transporter CrcB [Acetobacter farinalis]MCX2561681.1 fluoride efflux transporter CrcB [Acetobacter farinalis]NHO30178.1 fluoride efflux transporter CrcB [Acetobacter farinalis]
MSFMSCLLVMLGGALGTLARYAMTLLTAPLSRMMPWGTIVGINVLGSFIIGFFSTLTLADGRYPVSDNTRLFVMVGLCGGYTTFSSFSLQTLDLLRSAAWGRALANVTLSVVLCLGAVSFGHLLASRLNSQATRLEQASQPDAPAGEGGGEVGG